MSLHSSFVDYRNRYLAFLRALGNTQLVAGVAAYSMAEFPRRLPNELRLAVAESFLQLLHAAPAILAQMKRPLDVENSTAEVGGDSQESSVICASTDLEIDRFATHAVEILIAGGYDPKSGTLLESDSRFQAIARQQAIAMTFAHLDAFLGDTVRTICAVRPEILRTSKQTTWAAVLEFENLEQFVEHIADQYVYEFGWKTVTDRILTLREKLGLDLVVERGDLERLQLFEQRRHLVIHNGGVVTARYLRESKDDSSRLGETLSLSSDDIHSLHETVKLFGSDVCTAVSMKFLGAERKDLTRIWFHKPKSKVSDDR